METFAIRDLTFYYPDTTVPALEHCNLTVERGDFFILCGPSGCGKSTLLRQLKSSLAPHGISGGSIAFLGKPLQEWDVREQSQRIGFVRQNPDSQIVTDKVWHELAFGLESLGYDTPTIRRRVAEMASFFGIQEWFHRDVTELSGGQKQLLNLASVMVLQPEVLILDEPTAQLDPIAAGDFLNTLGKINRELGTTILLTEHRLDEVFPFVNRAAFMESGSILCAGAPRDVGAWLKQQRHPMFRSMPAAMQIWSAVDTDTVCPVTIPEGRQWLTELAKTHPLREIPDTYRSPIGAQTVIHAKELWFRYEKDAPDVIKGLSFDLQKGDFFAILGGNGAGKTTTLKLLAGLQTPQRGELNVTGRMGLLPQDPQTLFVKATVREDLLELGASESRTREMVQLCQLSTLLDRHPYDLSGGEQQRLALAKVLLSAPEILLLDEPTKGLDAEFKVTFAEILRKLSASGVTIVMISHDVEFCAEYARTCALFFDGKIVTASDPRSFFAGNRFYTTSANRIARELLPTAITAQDVILACGGKTDSPVPPESKEFEDFSLELPKAPPLPRWRKRTAVLSGLIACILFFAVILGNNLSDWVTGGGLTETASSALSCNIALLAALFLFSFAVVQQSGPELTPDLLPRQPKQRAWLSAALICILVPLTLWLGITKLHGRKYYFISLLILMETMLPFFIQFERRKPQARELVLIAALCAINVAGRVLFFMLPQFKPVIAFTILCGVALGGETGFLVGAVTMLVSNILFSQGPWTPWQMFAMGLIGFLAGILFRKGRLRRNRISLCVFGALSAIIVYGGIMNPVSALLWTNHLSWKLVLPYYLTGFPMDCVQAAATWLFLWFGGKPMLEKLERIQVKYGLLESSDF